jgi:hypothetical protein
MKLRMALMMMRMKLRITSRMMMNMKLRMIQNDGNSEVQGNVEDDDADVVEDDIEEMIVRMKMMKERIIRG